MNLWNQRDEVTLYTWILSSSGLLTWCSTSILVIPFYSFSVYTDWRYGMFCLLCQVQSLIILCEYHSNVLYQYSTIGGPSAINFWMAFLVWWSPGVMEQSESQRWDYPGGDWARTSGEEFPVGGSTFTTSVWPILSSQGWSSHSAQWSSECQMDCVIRCIIPKLLIA